MDDVSNNSFPNQASSTSPPQPLSAPQPQTPLPTSNIAQPPSTPPQPMQTPTSSPLLQDSPPPSFAPSTAQAPRPEFAMASQSPAANLPSDPSPLASPSFNPYSSQGAFNMQQPPPPGPTPNELALEYQPVLPRKKFYQSKKFFGSVFLMLFMIGTTALVLPVIQRQAPVSTTETQAELQAPLTLTIESPADKSLVAQDTLLIKGTTSPNTVVVFFTDTAEGSVDSNAQGLFQGTLQLEDGINTVTISAYSESGEEKTETLDVVYDRQST